MTNPLAAARIAAGITVAELARRCDCCEATIRRAERGGGRVTFDRAAMLARIVGIDPMAYLVRSGGETPKEHRGARD